MVGTSENGDKFGSKLLKNFLNVRDWHRIRAINNGWNGKSSDGFGVEFVAKKKKRGLTEVLSNVFTKRQEGFAATSFVSDTIVEFMLEL